jgi:hypothetical protein
VSAEALDAARRAILTARALGNEPNWDKISYQTGLSRSELLEMAPGPAPAAATDLSNHPWDRVREAYDHTLGLVRRWEDRNELAKDLQDLHDQRTRLTNRIDALAAELVSMGVIEGDDPE